MKIQEIKFNDNNPRTIRDDMFYKLVKSIKEFPQMLELRPLIIDENNVVLGGNMRLKALHELNYTEVPVKKIEGLTEEQKQEFIIKDNLSYGEWDWDMLLDEWQPQDLSEWGLEVMEFDEELDYSILDDDEETDDVLDDMHANTIKSVCISVPDEHYISFRDKVRHNTEKGIEVWRMLNEIL